MNLKEVVKKCIPMIRDGNSEVVFYKLGGSWCAKSLSCSFATVFVYYSALADICNIDSRAILLDISDIDDLCDENCIERICELVDYQYTNGKRLVVNELENRKDMKKKIKFELISVKDQSNSVLDNLDDLLNELRSGDVALFFWKKGGLLCADYLICSEISIKNYYDVLCDISKIDPGAVVINGFNGIGLLSNEIPLIEYMLNDLEIINAMINKGMKGVKDEFKKV